MNAYPELVVGMFFGACVLASFCSVYDTWRLARATEAADIARRKAK